MVSECHRIILSHIWQQDTCLTGPDKTFMLSNGLAQAYFFQYTRCLLYEPADRSSRRSTYDDLLHLQCISFALCRLMLQRCMHHYDMFI